MNKLENILNILNIKCSRCLDTKKLWSKYQETLDEYSCHYCSSGNVIKYNVNMNISLFDRNDNDMEKRWNILQPISKYIEDKKTVMNDNNTLIKYIELYPLHLFS